MTMSKAISNIQKALVHDEIGKLTPSEQIELYNQTCESLGLNPLTRPLGFYNLNGKYTLYAKKDATDQLRTLKKVSIYKLENKLEGETYIVTAYARNAEGREDSDVGCVDLKGLTGDKRSNAIMKCVTKAKRRVTLSLCGLGLLDETEVETIKDARPVDDTKIDPKLDAPQDDIFGNDIPNHAPQTQLEAKNFTKPIAKIMAKKTDEFHAHKNATALPTDSDQKIEWPSNFNPDVNDPGEHKWSGGKYEGLKMSEITVHDLHGYCDFLLRSANAQNKSKPTGWLGKDYQVALLYMKTREVKREMASAK